MKRRIISITTIISVIICIANVGLGESLKSGAINKKMLKTIQESVGMDKYTKAMQNAVSNNEIKKLALNRDLAGKIDHHFAYRIETPSVTNQKSSGRCWLFTALNVLRPKVIDRFNLEDFEFSESYLFFWDQLEKSNLFLEAIIKTRKEKVDNREVEWLFKHPVSDGGVWNMMPCLVEKYGMVPKEIMPESYNTENTHMMRRLMRRKLREHGMKLREYSRAGKSVRFLREKKTEMLSDIYRILIISLGTPPDEFIWRYIAKEDSVIQEKIFTPMSFYKEVVQIDLYDYVMLMDDPSKEYYKLYEIKYDRNRYDCQNWTFINLPSSELKGYAKRSILADEPMYFSCDVGKQLNEEQGFLALGMYDYESVFGIEFGMDKRERILSFDSGSTHGMALIGIDTTSTGEITKWLLENSWGPERGHNGYLTMTDEWFDEYMFRVVIHKEFLPDRVVDLLKQEAIKLPPWDPMF